MCSSDLKAAEIEAELARIEAERAADFSAALHEMLSCLQRHAAEVQPTFVRDMQQTAPDLFQTVETRRAALIQRYFGKLFDEGRRAGMVRKDLPPQLAIAILLAAIQGVVNPQKIGELGLTPQAALTAILSAVLDGILTPTGRKNP